MSPATLLALHAALGADPAGSERLLLCRPVVRGEARLARADALPAAARQLGGRYLDYGVPCEEEAEAVRAARRAGLPHAVSATAEGRSDGSRFALTLSSAAAQRPVGRRELQVAPGDDAVAALRLAPRPRRGGRPASLADRALDRGRIGCRGPGLGRHPRPPGSLGGERPGPRRRLRRLARLRGEGRELAEDADGRRRRGRHGGGCGRRRDHLEVRLLMRVAAAIAAAFALAACGPAGQLPRCGRDADCAPGTVCERPVSGEAGVCIAAYALAILEPAPGTWIGTGGAVVRVSLRAQADGRVEPPALELRAAGAAVATLPSSGPGLYQGTWVPAAPLAGPVSIAAVAAAGTPDESSSPVVGVLLDLVAPSVSGLSTSCAPACVRDGTMRVRATAADANLDAVTATLDLEPARAVALARAGADFVADVDLGSFPFPALSQPVAVTVKARDLAGNEGQATATATVTRVRWAYAAGAPVTSPAIMGDGTLAIGVSATTGQARGVHPDGTEAWRLTLEPGPGAGNFVTAPPSVGAGAIYYGSQDGRLYAVKLDGSAVLNGTGCATGAGVSGTIAVKRGPPEVAFGASNVGRVYGFDAGSLCAPGPATNPFTAGPSVDLAGRVLAATATATAILRQYDFDGLAFTERWNVAVGVNVSAPLAVDAAGNAWSGSQDARLNVTTPGGATATLATLPGSIVDSAVILANGDVAVGDQSNTLHRFRPDGSSAWAVEPDLGAPVHAPLVLAGAGTTLLVPTAAGTVHLVAEDGTVLWGGALTGGQALHAGNLLAGAGSFSTAYFGSADGKLYAVVVEGRLDAAAPWPRAHHDVRNTGDAAGPLP
jgi:hypothetical protein